MMRILRRPLGFVMVDGQPVWALDALAGYWIGNLGLGALAGAVIAGLRSGKGKNPIVDLAEPGYDLARKAFPKVFSRVEALTKTEHGRAHADAPESGDTDSCGFTQCVV